MSIFCENDNNGVNCPKGQLISLVSNLLSLVREGDGTTCADVKQLWVWSFQKKITAQTANFLVD